MLSIVRNVASNVGSYNHDIFFEALLYNVVSSFNAIANAGSIGINKSTKWDFQSGINLDNFVS
jgi:hypothetical protein